MMRFPERSELSFSLTERLECGRPVWRLNGPAQIWLDFPGQAVPAFLSTLLYFAVRLKRRPINAGASASSQPAQQRSPL